MSEIVSAMEPFSVTLKDGTPYAVNRGDLFYSDDQVVKGRENLFGAVQVRSSKPAATRATETATAAPGERRAPQVKRQSTKD